MTDLCTQLWSNLFFIGEFKIKKINHQKFKNQVLLEVFGHHKFKNKNKIIKLLYLICNVQAKI